MRREYYKYHESPIVDFEAFKKKNIKYRFKLYMSRSLEELINDFNHLLSRETRWHRIPNESLYGIDNYNGKDFRIPDIKLLLNKYKIGKDILKQFISLMLIESDFKKLPFIYIDKMLLAIADENLKTTNEEAYDLYVRLAQVPVSGISK